MLKITNDKVLRQLLKEITQGNPFKSLRMHMNTAKHAVNEGQKAVEKTLHSFLVWNRLAGHSKFGLFIEVYEHNKNLQENAICPDSLKNHRLVARRRMREADFL